MDLDEALVTLWEAGLAFIEDENSVIPARVARRARSAVGLEDSRAWLSVDYWLDLSGLSREDLADRLRDVGVNLAPEARKIPRNSLRRLRSMFADRPVSVVEVPREVPRVPPMHWRTIGNSSIRRYLDEYEIEAIHEALTEAFCESGDPISPPGVNDYNLLSSASHRPRTSLGEHLKYPTLEMAAAALIPLSGAEPRVLQW